MSNIYLNSFYLETFSQNYFPSLKNSSPGQSPSRSNEEFPRDYLINVATYLFAYHKITLSNGQKPA